MDIFIYITRNNSVILDRLWEHLLIVCIGVPLGILIGVPLGVAGAFHKRLGRVVTTVSGVLMTIPSVALFGITLIFLSPLNIGIGAPTAIVALIVYSLLPIIRNTIIAIRSVRKEMVEAARGMGMTRFQILFKVRFPIALPIIMAGIRNAAVMGVGVTTIAYLVGAQSLGYLIFTGLSRTNINMIITGALLVGFLGIGVNALLLVVERMMTSPGLKHERRQRDD